MALRYFCSIFNMDTERSMKYSGVVMNVPYWFLCLNCGREVVSGKQVNNFSR